MEMSVFLEIRTVTGRPAVQIHLLDESAVGQRFKTVVNRGQRNPRHAFLGPDKHLRRRRMVPLVPDHLIHLAALFGQPTEKDLKLLAGRLGIGWRVDIVDEIVM